MKGERHLEWVSRIKRECLAGLQDGVARGWWDAVDEEAMLPVKSFGLSEFHDTATLAHAWMRLGKFPSMKEAKRAGWNKPLEVGRYRIGTYIMDILDDAHASG